jgi:hypothetical protein
MDRKVFREQFPEPGHVSVQLGLIKRPLEGKDLIGHAQG